jgi:hypothetical protein
MISHFWTYETHEKVENKLKENVKIVITKKPEREISLNMKKTVDGNILIDENVDFYIFILPYETKIITIPKDYSNKFCTERQVKFFDYLTKEGFIKPQAVQAGELYGSFETEYLVPREEERGVLESLLAVIFDFIQEEKGDGEISVEDIKNRLMNMVGRRDNETDPVKAKEVEDDRYVQVTGGVGGMRLNGLSSPSMGTYFFE